MNVHDVNQDVNVTSTVLGYWALINSHWLKDFKAKALRPRHVARTLQLVNCFPYLYWGRRMWSGIAHGISIFKKYVPGSMFKLIITVTFNPTSKRPTSITP
jgi:hypothetical protein